MTGRARAAALAALLLASPAKAQYTGAELLRDCTGGSAQQGRCMGFLAGLWSGLRDGREIELAHLLQHELVDRPLVAIINDAARSSPLRLCASSTLTPEHLRVAVVAYLRRGPTPREGLATSLATEAFVSAFPCPSK